MNMRGRKGWLAPANSKRTIQESGGKPPFPTSNMLRSLVPIKLLRLEALIPSLESGLHQTRASQYNLRW
jgi:hypothetical protein